MIGGVAGVTKEQAGILRDVERIVEARACDKALLCSGTSTGRHRLSVRHSLVGRTH